MEQPAISFYRIYKYFYWASLAILIGSIIFRLVATFLDYYKKYKQIPEKPRNLIKSKLQPYAIRVFKIALKENRNLIIVMIILLIVLVVLNLFIVTNNPI